MVSSGAFLRPTPINIGPVMEHVLGGWQVNGIVQAQTGFPQLPEHIGCSSGSRCSTCSTRRGSDSPSGTIGMPNFGVITTAEDGRVIELAVKYNF